jgi:valyl-tRNA synthetase
MGLIIGASAGKTSSVSYEKFKGYRNFVNKIWNATRFILMNYDKVGDEIQEKSRGVVKNIRENGSKQEWFKKIQELELENDEKLEKFRFSLAAEQLHQNFWYEFCDKWIEETKNFLNDEGNKAEDKAEKLGLLIYALTRYLRLLHPFMPFITEELWQKLRKLGMVEEETIQLSK